jgi:hypothetical protein
MYIIIIIIIIMGEMAILGPQSSLEYSARLHTGFISSDSEENNFLQSKIVSPASNPNLEV